MGTSIDGPDAIRQGSALHLSDAWAMIGERSPLPMAIVQESDHILRHVNPAFCALMNKSAQLLIGTAFRDLLPARDAWVALIDAVYSSGLTATHALPQPSQPLLTCATWPLISSGLTVGVVLQINTQPRGDMLAINEALVLGSVRQHELTQAAEAANARLKEEIAERLRIEAALRESEERYRALFRAVPVAVMASDKDGLLESFNRRAVELLGRKPRIGDSDEHYFGQTKLYMPDGRLLSTSDNPIASVLRNGTPLRNVELTVEQPDGARIPIVVNISPLRGFEGKITGAITSFDDISERKRAEEVLSDAAEQKNQFLAMLAHELRNPLAPMRFAMDIVQQAGANSEVAQPALQMMERQMGHMTRLVDDLLDIGRITRGKLELRREEVELGSVINPLVEASRQTCSMARQELTVTLPPSPIYLNADPVRLAQVFGNLLNNAIKFTAPGGSISLHVEKELEDVIVRVKDSGIGIDAELLPRMFRIFTQGDQTLVRSHGGLGIGLALVRRLVTMHGGTVEASSEGLGCGSEFTVRLPTLSRRHAMMPEDVPPIEPEPVVSRRILVVDDNHDAAEALSMLLTMTGHETHTAFDGVEAVEAAATYQPDIILLDIGLPRLNGHDAARRIRELPGGKDIVIVALTGWGQKEDRQKTQASGFDAHMVKPVDYKVLARLLASYQVGARGASSPVQ